MKCVLQRVSGASVVVDGKSVGSIGLGWLALVCAEVGDAPADADWLADRVAGVRAFSDQDGKMNRSVRDVAGSVLVVSQFTLAANLAKGRRPSFEGAMEPVGAKALCDRFTAALGALEVPTAAGVFGADMKVSLTNDGPVTLLLESRGR